MVRNQAFKVVGILSVIVIFFFLGSFQLFDWQPVVLKQNSDGEVKDQKPTAKIDRIVATVVPNHITQQERQRTLRRYCRTEKALRKETLFYHTVIHSDVESVIYCAVPKVASSNWKRMMYAFEKKIASPSNITNQDAVHNLPFSYLLKLPPQEQNWRKGLYYSFMFVRHPFERIVSAYRNKFSHPVQDFYQKTVGRAILKLYRQNLTKQHYASGKGVTFQEFVNYLIHLHDSKSGFDEHWRPVHFLCSPCSFKYNFIGKMETLHEDALEILTELGLERNYTFPSKPMSIYNTKSENLTRSHFEKIKPSSLRRLYQIYKHDFLAFGYSIPDYLKDSML